MAKKQAGTKRKSSPKGAARAARRERPAQVFTPPGDPLKPRKLPRQERARVTVEAIIRAGAELFARTGYARTTTNKIAKRAGVSIGSLYQYFPSKDAILSAIFALHQAQVEVAIRQGMEELATPGIPLEHGFRTLLAGMVAVHEEEPDITGALSEVNIHLAGADKHHDDQEGRYARVTADILAARPEVRPGDHLLMARLVVESTAHLIRWLVHDSPREVDRAAAVDELILMLTRYLER